MDKDADIRPILELLNGKLGMSVVDWNELRSRIHAYGEACRRAGAEAMREIIPRLIACIRTPSGGPEIISQRERTIADAEALLALPPAAEAAPPAAGWRLVPIEPTEAMTGRPGSAAATRRRNTWKAMLELAPFPPNTEDARGG